MEDPCLGSAMAGGRTVLELPIVVQDKIFVGPDIFTVDPTWPGPSSPGSLWYAHEYDITRYGKLGPAPSGPPPAISAVPEYFGDTMLANGTVYPEVTVEARRYRLRILNACNARFLNLQMYVDDGGSNGITLDHMGNALNIPAQNAAALNPAGHPTNNFLVLGTEGGFLPNPAFVPSGVPFNGTAAGGSLLIAPAEPVNVLFDFSAHAGQKLILYSDATAPFPGGDPRYHASWLWPQHPRDHAVQCSSGNWYRRAAGHQQEHEPCGRQRYVAGTAGRNDSSAGSASQAAHAQRNLRQARPPDPVPRHQRCSQSGHFRAHLPGCADGGRGPWDNRGMADRQFDGRHAPHPLPLGQRADHLSAGVRGDFLHWDSEPEKCSGRAGPRGEGLERDRSHESRRSDHGDYAVRLAGGAVRRSE